NHLVTLSSGLKVRGIVQDNDAHPVAGAKVGESHHFAGPRLSTLTDGAGAFELGPFAPGDIRLEASADGFAESNTRVEVNAAATNLVLTLSLATGAPTEWEQGMMRGSTVQLTGTVVDALSGQPIPQFRVRMREHR